MRYVRLYVHLYVCTEQPLSRQQSRVVDSTWYLVRLYILVVYTKYIRGTVRKLSLHDGSMRCLILYAALA